MSNIQNSFDFMSPVTAAVPSEIVDLIARGATFFVNHSGGKDMRTL